VDGGVTLLDARDLLCPLPVLKLRKALAAMPAGARIRVLTTDPVAVIDIPHFCVEAGHRVIETGQEDAADVFVIERGQSKTD